MKRQGASSRLRDPHEPRHAGTCPQGRGLLARPRRCHPPRRPPSLVRVLTRQTERGAAASLTCGPRGCTPSACSCTPRRPRTWARQRSGRSFRTPAVRCVCWALRGVLRRGGRPPRWGCGAGPQSRSECAGGCPGLGVSSGVAGDPGKVRALPGSVGVGGQSTVGSTASVQGRQGTVTGLSVFSSWGWAMVIAWD